MKQRKRIQQCANCGHVLKSTDNFCPECGQENHYHNFSFRELWADFSGAFINFDGLQ